MIRSFTGPTHLSKEQRIWVARRILIEPVADVWRSGCAKGVDTIAARLGFALDADLELYIPFAPHHETMVRELAPVAKVIRCPKMAGMSACYRRRNTMMVQGSDHLLAFVTKPVEEFYRSGEWMTINIARKLGVPATLEKIPS